MLLIALMIVYVIVAILVTLPIAMPLAAVAAGFGDPGNQFPLPGPIRVVHVGLALLLPALTAIISGWSFLSWAQGRRRPVLALLVAAWVSLIGLFVLGANWGCIGSPPPGEIYLCNTTGRLVTYSTEPAVRDLEAFWARTYEIQDHRARRLSRLPADEPLRITAVDRSNLVVFCQEYTLDDVNKLSGRISVAAGQIHC